MSALFNRSTAGTDRLPRLWLWAAVVVGAAALLLLQSMTTFTSDDYYYAAFWRDGLSGFLSRNWEHFLSRNGRVLVHMAAESILALGPWAFALCSTGSLAAALLLFLDYQMDRRPTRTQVLWALAAYFTALLWVDFRVMKGWFLCVVDMANYILPLAIIGLFLACLVRIPGRAGGAAALCFAFLAGATTEQAGAMALGLALLHVLYCRLAGNRWDRRALACLPLVLAGLMTVFASPATRDRVGAEFSVTGVLSSFVQYANSFSAPGLSLNILVLFCVLSGLLPLTGRAPKGLLAGLPVGAVLALGFLLPPNPRWNTVTTLWFFLYLLWAAALLIFRSPHARSGFLLLAGLGSAAAALLSRSCSIRVTTPLILLLLLCAVYFLTLLIPAPGRRSAAALFLAVSAALFLLAPVFSGMGANCVVRQQNRAAVEKARVTGVLDYSDYRAAYCLQPLFSNEIITSQFLNYHQLPGVKVNSHYHPGPSIQLAGQQEQFLLWNGQQYLPLSAVTAHCGGQLTLVADNYFVIRLNGVDCVYQGPHFWIRRHAAGTAEDLLSYNNRTYISTCALEEIFGLTF